MEAELEAFPVLRAFLEAEVEADDPVAHAELARLALAEQIAHSPSDFASMQRLAPRPALVAYLRMFRVLFVDADGAEGMRHAIRVRGTVTCVATMVWLVEAFVNLYNARAWYSPPLLDKRNSDFPALGIAGGRFPTVRAVVVEEEVGKRKKGRKKTRVIPAARAASNWEFAAPVCKYSSFEVEATLEYLTWCATSQVFPVAGGRTAQWLCEFEDLFELVRARAHVMCTQALPAEYVDETHRLICGDVGWGRSSGPGNGMTNDDVTAGVVGKAGKSEKIDLARVLAQFDGDSDVGDLGEEEEEEEEPRVLARVRFAESGSESGEESESEEEEEEEELVSVSSVFQYATACYVDSLEAELLLARSLVVAGRPRDADLSSKVRRARVEIVRQVDELDKVDTMQKFKTFVARGSLLPCDRRIYDVRVRQRNPTPGEIATKKNHNMVAVASPDATAAAFEHTRVFCDYVMDVMLRSRFGTSGRFPTDAVCAGFAGGEAAGFRAGEGLGSTGWSWDGNSFAEERGGPRVLGGDDDADSESDGGEGGDQTQAAQVHAERLRSEGPTLCDLVCAAPRARPALFRCALLDVYCVTPGGGRPCNHVYTFTSLVAAMIWMRDQTPCLLPDDLAKALDDYTREKRAEEKRRSGKHKRRR